MSKERDKNKEAGETSRDIQKRETDQREAVVGEPERKDEQAEVAVLKERLGKCEEQNRELEDRLLRLAAEFDNYRKRTAREFGSLVKMANENLILKLLGTIDDFCRAVNSDEAKKDFKGFCDGVEMIYAQLWEVLSGEGVEEIKSIGQKFDPNFHEAIGEIDSDEYEEGMVAGETSKGYSLKGRVIKPAKVLVAKQKHIKEKKD